MKILVTGGAGYIGSHFLLQLREWLGSSSEHQVAVLDNLSTGRREAVLFGELIIADLADREQVENIFNQHKFDAVIHFAASISVPESVSNPLKYYRNNTANTLQLLEMCQQFKVTNFIFSSTAAVYGDVSDRPIPETEPCMPTSPYGATKWMSERILIDMAQAHGMRYVILRYFNAAGAEGAGRLGQAGKEHHLIKVACETALKQRPDMALFGTDYPTSDGTCIRDYIHVKDLAHAHIDALKYLSSGGKSQIFNCGYGQGFSVKEVIEAVRSVSGVNFPVRLCGRRSGDPAVIIADSRKIRAILGWQPQHDSLGEIVQSAYSFASRLEKKQPGQYQEEGD